MTIAWTADTSTDETPAMRCIAFEPASSAPKSSAARITPSGCRRPSSATAMAVKP